MLYMMHDYCGEVFEQPEFCQARVEVKHDHQAECGEKGKWTYNMTEDEAF